MNGAEQNYHHADVFESGLQSPLLRLLNARYLILPAVAAQDQVVPRTPEWSLVAFQDDSALVLENPAALPRSWIVHAGRQVGMAEALDLLASGAADPRREALLEEPPPELVLPADASLDAASVTGYEPEDIRVHVRTQAPGLVVLSEVGYPAWHADVDGKPAPLYVADGALRAIPVTAGEHQLELRYESATLAAGLSITLASAAVLAMVALACLRPRRL